MADVVPEVNKSLQQEALFDGFQKALQEGQEIPVELTDAFTTVRAVVDFFDSGKGFDLDIDKQEDRNKWCALMDPISDLFGKHR